MSGHGAGRWLVVGAGGMLGREVVDVARSRGLDVTAATRADLDVTDPQGCREAAAGYDVVVNAAAWTAVDDAEEQEAAAYAVNATGAANLARACARAGARLVHVSTDYVFDGTASTPYAEDAATRPCSAYGRTKLAGEWAVRAEHPGGSLVLRTAWLYGRHGTCFPRTIARALLSRKHLDVVEDQVGQPTWSRDVAELAVALVAAAASPGTYHATSSGQTSWCGFARAVVKASGADPERVRPTTSAAFMRRAQRPAYSVLAHQSLQAAGVEPIGPWPERLSAAVADGLLSDL